MTHKLENMEYIGQLFKLSSDFLCAADLNGYFKLISPSLIQKLGYSEEELLSRPFLEFVYPDDRERTEAEILKLSSGVDTVCFENRFLKKDGTTLWLSWNCPAPKPEEGILYAVARDITDQKKMEGSLHESRTRYNELADLLPQTVYEIDLEGNLLYINQHGLQIFGYTEEDLQKGLNVIEGFVPEERDRIFNNLQKILNGEGNKGAEYTAKTKDGSTLPVLAYSSLVYRGNEPVGYRGVLVDISERKRSEEAIARLGAIVETSSDAIIGKTLKGVISSWNKGAEKLYGYTEKEVLGKSISILFPTDRTWELNEILENIKQNKSIRQDAVRLRKDGRPANVSLTISPIKDRKGRITGASTIAHDITKHKQLEARLQESTARNDAILNTAVDGIITINEKGIVERVNKSVQKIFGYEPEEVIGQNIKMLMPDPFHSEHDTYLSNYIETGIKRIIGIGREVMGLRKDGTTFPLYLAVSEVQVGKKRLFTGIVRDISKRKKFEMLIKEKNEELKAFAYTVSHDLKAPLRGISGYAREMVRRHQEGLSERALFCLDQIMTATNSLDRLIEDLLQYSRLDRTTPSMTEVKLSEMIRGILDQRSSIIEEQGIEISIELPFQSLYGWDRGINQVLSNLIDNAIKFSRNASPSRVRIQGEETSTGYRFIVTDNGIGFDMKYHDRLFEIFHRLVRQEEFEGTGAGLAIVKKILEKQGGKIWAESKPGEGAAFFVEIPKPKESRSFSSVA